VCFVQVAAKGEDGEEMVVVFPWQLTVAIVFGSMAALFLGIFVILTILINKQKRKIEPQFN
jgi:hypothetical protein